MEVTLFSVLLIALQAGLVVWWLTLERVDIMSRLGACRWVWEVLGEKARYALTPAQSMRHDEFRLRLRGAIDEDRRMSLNHRKLKQHNRDISKMDCKIEASTLRSRINERDSVIHFIGCKRTLPQIQGIFAAQDHTSDTKDNIVTLKTQLH